MNSEATLTSLAMLKVNIDHGGDYLEYLRPFVLRVLKFSRPEIINDAFIAQKLLEDHGLEIPKRTVQILLQRLARSGLLSKKDGVFYVSGEVETVKDWTSDNAAASRKIASVVQWLKDFATTHTTKELDDDRAMESVISFLSKFSIPCLKAYLRGTALPTVTSDSNWQIVLVSHFVQSLQKNDPERFDDFMVIVQGHMLANALLCPDLASITNTYKEVTFFLDTPLLVQYLGLEGDEKKHAIEDLVNLVQRLDGKLAYFTHTRDELMSVIRGAADFIDSPKGRGAIVYEGRRSKCSKSDLLLLADKAIEILATSKIQEQPTPAYIAKFQIDETVFSEALSDEVHYYNPKAREYDINSVRSVYVLRGGGCPHSVEKSKAILVTNNTGLAKAAFEYGRNVEQSREVSTVITDFSLVNTAWLKAPQGAPSLPRKEVLAFAYAAMRPSTAFWEKVLDEADKLEASGKITARDHQLLRSSQHVQEELMKLTLGEDAALSDATITGILTRVASEIKKEEAQKLAAAEQAKEVVEQKLEESINKHENIRQTIYWMCDKSAKKEAILLSVLIWTGQLVVAASGIYVAFRHKLAGVVLIIIAAVTSLLRVSGTIWDIKPLSVYKKFYEWRKKNKIQKRYAELGIEE